MFRYLLGATAAIALLTGTAYAQDSIYYNRTDTVTTPFGSSRTMTTTRTQAPSVVDEGEDLSAPPAPVVSEAPPPSRYDEEEAAVPDSPPPPPRPYSQQTRTRRITPDGVETEIYQDRQTYYDSDGPHTVVRTHSTTYDPPYVYQPSAGAVGPAPTVEMPPYREHTVVTTTTDGD